MMVIFSALLAVHVTVWKPCCKSEYSIQILKVISKIIIFNLYYSIDQIYTTNNCAGRIAVPVVRLWHTGDVKKKEGKSGG